LFSKEYEIKVKNEFQIEREGQSLAELLRNLTEEFLKQELRKGN